MRVSDRPHRKPIVRAIPLFELRLAHAAGVPAWPAQSLVGGNVAFGEARRNRVRVGGEDSSRLADECRVFPDAVAVGGSVNLLHRSAEVADEISRKAVGIKTPQFGNFWCRPPPVIPISSEPQDVRL